MERREWCMDYRSGKWAKEILDSRNEEGMWGNFHTLAVSAMSVVEECVKLCVAASAMPAANTTKAVRMRVFFIVGGVMIYCCTHLQHRKGKKILLISKIIFQKI